MNREVFNSPLGDDATANPLVDNDSKGVGANIEHTTSSAMVGLVWHTLLDSTITLEKNKQNVKTFLITITR